MSELQSRIPDNPQNVDEFISWLDGKLTWLEGHAKTNDLAAQAYFEVWQDAHGWATDHLSPSDVELLEPQPKVYWGTNGLSFIHKLKRLYRHLIGDHPEGAGEFPKTLDGSLHVPPCNGCGSPPASLTVNDICPNCGAWEFHCGLKAMATYGGPPVSIRLHTPFWEEIPPSKVVKPGTSKKKRGRKLDSDPKNDKSIHDGWKKSNCRSYEEYGKICGRSKEEVCKAVDRHEKRLQKAKEKLTH